MRLSVLGLLILILAGCAGKKASAPRSGSPAADGASPAANRTNLNIIVTPASSAVGKVASANSVGRFVVISFPIASVPPNERRFNVYRGGLKVGEVKITGPRRDNHTVADIVAGECQVGDEVREN